ncbi:MAG: hypothetical protein ACRENU_00205 [Gemmatimonadaceae bacterium]
MKLRVLIAVVALGCGDGTSPEPTPLTLGEFALVSVDDQTLPRQLTLSGGNCTVSESTLELQPTETIQWAIPCDASSPVVAYFLSMPFHQVAVDSFVAPRFPPQSSVSPSLFGRKNGTTLTVVTLSHHTLGAHTWIFQAVP